MESKIILYIYRKKPKAYIMNYLKYIQRLEAVCALISISLLIVVYFHNHIDRLKIQTWDETMVVSPNSTLTNAIENFQIGISSFCGNDKETHMPQLVFLPNENAIGKSPRNTFYGTIIAVNAHVTYAYQPILFLIFFISCFFQLLRVNTIDSHTYELRESIIYTPSSPDFSRWLEYMLTTPLQMLIICSTVAIGDSAALQTIIYLQGMLVLTGYMSELLIDRLYEHAQYDSVLDRCLLQVSVVLCAEWIVFYSIWKTVIGRYYRNNVMIQECGTQKNSGFKCSEQYNEKSCHEFDICEWQNVEYTCDNNNRIPNTIDLVIWGQFILFLAFGIVHTTQIFFAVYNAMMGCTCKHLHTKPQTWLFYSFVYSILSISAKVILFVGVILILNEMPP